jgi:hypothetical protein
VYRLRESTWNKIQILSGRVLERERQLRDLKFGNALFMTMDEQQQQSFFDSIFNLPAVRIDVREATDNATASQAITISTSALLETLPQSYSTKISMF